MDIFGILYEDDDQKIVEFLNYQCRTYTIRVRVDHMTLWDDHDFRIKFRISKVVVLQVLEQINGQISSSTDRNHAVTPINKLLLILRFYATGNFLITSGDFFGVSKTTASLIVRDVSIAIAKLRPRFIKMPTTEREISKLQRSFYQIARFPRAIGAIDCTHVKIQNPGGPNAEYFKNRKGYFSINVQTIACPNLKIMDVVARWPGSCHDKTIFKKSQIYYNLINGKWGNSLIVADSGYANSLHVVTPFLNPQNYIEELYNESIIRTRNPVERSYGVLKRRFLVLSLGLRLKLETTQAVTVACFVLYNIACDNNDIDSPILDIILPNNENINIEEQQPDGENARQQLIQEYFSHF
ncbi:LOW QUALITY PROTEIN: putative nuclease HARBI1 [Rhopalosiphum padi]|uniref:LOW QUALITY PROTEIN: putative nuclease HARBI1 n=1 Tax=Rhopalosiphum padi TaxID=40932 RepID=UPI00298E47B9|nr:LOW QUALITY PROTEIN: putative nuclease HARBI1 [Rhopalosiphum padi]